MKRISEETFADPQFPSDQDASGRLLGDEEIELVTRAIRSGILTSTKGEYVRRFCDAFAEIMEVNYASACASGTSAIHAAIAAVNPDPGDEIITSPITDIGAITPILYQTAIPVFADVDPRTGNLTAETVARVLSRKTRAIIVTHLFGNPAELQPILKLAQQQGIHLIEDCAQAYGAKYEGLPVGTVGDIGCFSLQQGKHITSGEGGIVITNDPELGRRIRLFIDKAWGYGDLEPDHYFLALNGRMSELQGAVALAQLRKLPMSVTRRRDMASKLTAGIADVDGVQAINSPHGGVQSFWKLALLVRDEVGGPDALSNALRGYGIASAPRYIQKPAFQCAVIRDQRTFGSSRFPFTLARAEAVDYSPTNYSGVYSFLKQVLVIPWNERIQEEHVDLLVSAVIAHCAGQTRRS